MCAPVFTFNLNWETFWLNATIKLYSTTLMRYGLVLTFYAKFMYNQSPSLVFILYRLHSGEDVKRIVKELRSGEQLITIEFHNRESISDRHSSRSHHAPWQTAQAKYVVQLTAVQYSWLTLLEAGPHSSRVVTPRLFVQLLWKWEERVVTEWSE